MNNIDHSRSAEIRRLMHEYLQNRQKNVLEKLAKKHGNTALAWFKEYEQAEHAENYVFFELSEEIQNEIRDCVAKYDLLKWIADAARRSGQLAFSTHPLKGSHPDAKGVAIHSHLHKQTMPSCYVSTQTSAQHAPLDVAGNAAALDIAAFLEMKIHNQSFLDLFFKRDPDLMAALPGEPHEKEAWALAFSNMMQSEAKPFVSTHVPQVYFPIENNTYHIVSPLWPSSLIQIAYDIIQYDLFSDDTKIAREARKKEQEHSHGLRDYPQLATQQMGGTKPQNISKLNSARRGTSYLLASLPPVWKSKTFKVPLHTKSIFGRIFKWQAKESLDALKQYIKDNTTIHKDINNKAIRDQRDELLKNILDDLLQYAATCQNESQGWSADSACQLEDHEKFWLDCYAYPHANHQKAIEMVSEDFARFLNSYLNHQDLGDEEHYVWAKAALQELKWAMPDIKTVEVSQ